ncbi:hypothetical protein [Mycolicibacterium sp. HK-90]|uniref:hypothetical protein n=1 Tax=Mycolicibacterium sp. HK-90 TaxID=3056937 RepID=UPI002658C7EB|nr:hypothetical protein [Mycolicibacterium sp. HK-90]WKG00841.1 hypothetical protein QU592_16075 [Mycolicibacterium sp. HK-90]
MSWDVFVMRFPAGIKASDEIPDSWDPENIGTVGAVRAALGELVPDMVWDATGWGQGTGDGFTVEVPLTDPDDAPTNGVTLMFRGGGDAPFVAMALAERFDARALASGEFLEPGNAEAALAEWHRFRARALGRHGETAAGAGQDSG